MSNFLDPNYFADISMIGGDGGKTFLELGGVNGKLVLELTVWKSASCIRGIQIKWTDHSSTGTIGTAAGDLSSITFMAGEKVTDLTLWGNGIGTRTGRIRLVTDQGRTFDWGKDTAGQTAYSIDVGSGYFAGAAGACGADIDRLCFVFIKPVASVIISQVQYGNLPPAQPPNIDLIALATADYKNDGSEPSHWLFSQSVTKTQTNTWSQNTTFSFGGSITVTAGFFDIIKVDSGFTWSVTSESSQSATEQSSVTLAWAIDGNLQPGESVHCVANCQLGTIAVAYTSTVQIILQNGYTITYNEPGNFLGTIYGYSAAQTEPITTSRNCQRTSAKWLEETRLHRSHDDWAIL